MRNLMTLVVVVVGCAVGSGCSAPAEEAPSGVAEEFGHFHPTGKRPSEHTLNVFEEARRTLPFSDRQDFEEWERGFIARRENLKIMADAGNVAWDMERYLCPG